MANPPSAEIAHRRPRFLAPAPDKTEFEIPSPPVIETPQSTRLVVLLIPALTGVSMLIYGGMTSRTILIFGIIVTVGAVTTPFLLNAEARRTARQRNDLRHQRYGELLDRVGAEAMHAAAMVRVGLETAHPTPDQLGQWLQQGRLWERRASDADFLDVALGVANIPSGVTVNVGTTSALEDEIFPDLLDNAAALERTVSVLESAPLCLSLRERAVVSVVGPRTPVLSLVRAMLLEMVVSCGPDELSLLVAVPPEYQRDWQWATSVPHAMQRTGGGSASTVVISGEDLSAALTPAVAARSQLLAHKGKEAPTTFSHLVVVLDACHPVTEPQETSLVQETLSRAGELGITVLAITGEPGTSPSEAAVLLSVGDDGSAVMRAAHDGTSVRFRPLAATAATARGIAAAISSLKLVNDLPSAADSGNDPRYPTPAS